MALSPQPSGPAFTSACLAYSEYHNQPEGRLVKMKVARRDRALIHGGSGG